MVDKIEISRTLRGSFVISEGTLRNIYRHINEAMGSPVAVSVLFENDRTIRSDDLDAILSDSSVSNFKIARLRMTSGSLGADSQAIVTLGLSTSQPAVLEIRGDRRLALSLEDSISNEIGGVNSPIWFVNTEQWRPVNINTSWGVFLIVLSLISFVAYIWGEWISKNIPFIWIILFWIAVSGFGVAGAIIAPSITFDFGRGATASRRRRNILNILLGVIFLGVIVNLLSAYISS